MQIITAKLKVALKFFNEAKIDIPLRVVHQFIGLDL